MKKTICCLTFILICIISCSDSDNLSIVLIDGDLLEAGTYQYIWDMRYVNGARVPEGLYEVKMVTAHYNAYVFLEISPLVSGGQSLKVISPMIIPARIPDKYGLRVEPEIAYPGTRVAISLEFLRPTGFSLQSPG